MLLITYQNSKHKIPQTGNSEKIFNFNCFLALTCSNIFVVISNEEKMEIERHLQCRP